MHLLISATKQAYKSEEFNSSKSFQRDQQHCGSATGISRGEALQTAIGKELPVYWHTYSRHTPNLKPWQKSEKAIKDTRWLFNRGGLGIETKDIFMQPEVRRLSLWGLTYFWSQPQVTLKVTGALATLSLLLFFFNFSTRDRCLEC